MLKSTTTIPSQMVIASSVVLIILSSNITFYTIIHKMKDIVHEFSTQRSNARNRFQDMLHDLIKKHKASLQMFDNICNLVNEYTSSPEFLVNTKLQSHRTFLRSIEGSYCTRLLGPNNQNVRLHDGTIVTVPVFDMKAMLTSLLTDQTLMVDTNFAEDYDVLTGGVDANNPSNDMYGEVHTGDAWIPARDRYCSNPQGTTMPVGLIVFGDNPIPTYMEHCL
jgi:hypothetical protein